MVYGGDQILDFVWIDTVVESLIRAGTGPVLVGPFNVGSGHPVTLVSLAERILSETSSGAGLQFLPGRSIEVSEFVADTCRMKGQLGVEPDREPLTHLSSLIEWTRGQFRCVGQTPARVFPLH
jgi:UDP-glucose 4-epimerase